MTVPMGTPEMSAISWSLSFGVGSDFTYQVYVGMEYAFTKTFSANLGYRQLYVDYKKDDRKIDLTFGGAMVGIGIRF